MTHTGLVKKACRRHGGYWADKCTKCEEKTVGKPIYTHQLEVRSLTEDVHIIWRADGKGYWKAYRETKNVHKQFVRLLMLDTDSLLEVFKAMRDIIAGTIDPDLINPDI